MRSLLRVFMALFLASAGCMNSAEEGAATGSVCDPTLSYQHDIAPIVERYCASCHSANVPLKRRHGAPGDHNFDSEDDVIAYALHIQMRAGIGPEAENRNMPPPGFRAPSDEQRVALARFMECQLISETTAPAHHH